MTPTNLEVSTVADARAGLTLTLRRFRLSPGEAPVILGSHRKPEAVLLPFARYAELDRPPVDELRRLRDKRAVIMRLAALNNIGAVAVFGSVANGTATNLSDVDLLVDPDDSATLFDLAQFEIDLEQVLERSVDVVSRASLDPSRDAAILASALPL